MFSGIIEQTASVTRLTPIEGGARLTLDLTGIAKELELGESVAVNGCCLTVAELAPEGLIHFDLLQQTLRLTNLGDLHEGDLVNIERALRLADRLSGHLVQGHVDDTSTILALEPDGQDHRLEVALPASLRRYTVDKGSITVDGISLTLADLQQDRFTIWITPHTFQATHLHARKAQEKVNLEVDVLAKYVERLLSPDPEK